MRRDALLVGTTQHADPYLAKLTAPAADVQQLHELLTSPRIGRFAAPAPLFNEPAHKVKVELEAFFSDRSRDDLLLLYFSGHGILDEEGQLYLAASNTDRKRLRSTAIEASFVRALMDGCRSETQLLVLDCCHSGAFGRAKAAALGSPVGTERAFEGNGRIVLTASDATQFSFEGNTLLGDTTTSLFTHFVVQGLRTGEADIDGDGVISVDELYAYTHEQVSRRTNAQTPGKWVYRQQGNVIIAHNASPRARLDLLSPELLRGIESSERSIQKGALEGLAEHMQGPHPGRALAAREKLRALESHDSRFISEAATRLLAQEREPVSPPGPPAAEVEAPRSKPASGGRGPAPAASEGAPSQPEPMVRSLRGARRDRRLAVSAVLVLVVAGIVTALVARRQVSEAPASPSPTSAASATPTPAAPAAAQVVSEEERIVGEARALMANGDVVGAHRKLDELPVDSSLRQSADLVEIERRWAEEMIKAARESPDPLERRQLLERVARASSVAPDVRERALELLASAYDSSARTSTGSSKPAQKRLPKKPPAKPDPPSNTVQPSVPPATTASPPAAAGSGGSSGVWTRDPRTHRPPRSNGVAEPIAQPAPSGRTASEFPCKNDAQCLSHRCNVAYGRCAWPCQSDADCQPGYTCAAPTCVPRK
ncbi:MAG TPA: caspase family protein [Polyangiaceae bacterium]|nr:caspase family protein [Polyangiaceae bacterium]